MPQKPIEVVRVHKEETPCVIKDVQAASALPKVESAKHNHIIAKEKRSAGKLLNVSKNHRLINHIHHKQFSIKKTPPRPDRNFEEELYIENAGLYSFLLGLITYLLLYWMIISTTPLAFLVCFIFSIAAALGAVVLGVMAIEQKEGVGFGLLGMILGGAWLFLLAILLALLLAI